MWVWVGRNWAGWDTHSLARWGRGLIHTRYANPPHATLPTPKRRHPPAPTLCNTPDPPTSAPPPCTHPAQHSPTPSSPLSHPPPPAHCCVHCCLEDRVPPANGARRHRHAPASLAGAPQGSNVRQPVVLWVCRETEGQVAVAQPGRDTVGAGNNRGAGCSLNCCLPHAPTPGVPVSAAAPPAFSHTCVNTPSRKHTHTRTSPLFLACSMRVRMLEAWICAASLVEASAAKLMGARHLQTKQQHVCCQCTGPSSVNDAVQLTHSLAANWRLHMFRQPWRLPPHIQFFSRV